MILCKYIPGLAALFFLASSLMGPVALAEEPVGYDDIATVTFWKKLYPGGGWSLYCGYKFNGLRKTSSGRTIDIEHIFSTTHMANHAGCNSRMQCREDNNIDFMRMEADLHNMYPVWQTIITHRYDSIYGLVEGEDWRFDDCDIEWKTGVVEPRNIARGNIARAMLYMHASYTIPVDKSLLAMYRIWNKMDPPSKQEQARNNVIEGLQGRRNPFVDHPASVERHNFRELN